MAVIIVFSSSITLRLYFKLTIASVVGVVLRIEAAVRRRVESVARTHRLHAPPPTVYATFVARVEGCRSVSASVIQ